MLLNLVVIFLYIASVICHSSELSISGPHSVGPTCAQRRACRLGRGERGSKMRGKVLSFSVHFHRILLRKEDEKEKGSCT
jgi:hypothetical protein